MWLAARIAVVAIALALIGAIVLPGAAAAKLLLDSRRGIPTRALDTLTEATTLRSGRPQTPDDVPEKATVSFAITRYDFVTRDLSANFEVKVGQLGRALLFDKDRQQYLLQGDSVHWPAPLASYGEGHIEFLDAEDGTVRKLTAPLDQVVKGDISASFDLAVVGNPDAFPDDSYAAIFVNPALVLPQGIVFHTAAGDTDAIALMVTSIGVSPTFSDFKLYYGLLPPESVQPFLLQFTRAPQESRFVAAMMYMPAGFGLIVLLAWLLEWRRGAPGAYIATLSTFPVVLTILPLRAVLVPSSITGLTRVDVVLGAEIVGILVVTAVIFAVATLVSSRGASQTQPVGDA